jgi:hypothetical protein
MDWEGLYRSVMPRVETRPVRRCPACRATWPVDWDYCAACAVWLPGTESMEQMVRLVPGDQAVTLGSPRFHSSEMTAAPGTALACEIRTDTERPSRGDLRRGTEMLRAMATAIIAHGGAAARVADAGVCGLWSLGAGPEPASRAATTILRAPGERGGLRGGRLSVGIGIAASEGDTACPPAAVDLAFRLATLAAPDSALVSQTVYERTRDWFDYRGVGPVVPRSDPLPGPVFVLVGAKPERSGSRSAAPDHVPLAGRADALRVLDECRERVATGRGIVLHLVGEPGSGKSRLVREWLAVTERSGTLADWVRLETDGIPYGGFPFRAWDRLLASSAPAAIRRAPAALSERLRSAGRPAVILVDDLHWVDAESRELLALGVAGLADLPALVILAYRPSFRAMVPALPARATRTLRLEGLSAHALHQLVAAVARRAAIELPPAVRAAIVARADGNPLYVEEAAAHLADVRHAGEAGRLPASLPELLIRRIEWTLGQRLPDLERRHQEAILVCGARFTSSAERQPILLELDALEERLAAWLDRLDVVQDGPQALVRRFLSGLRAVDGRLALLNLFLGRQRPHCARLAQALTRLGSPEAG